MEKEVIAFILVMIVLVCGASGCSKTAPETNNQELSSGISAPAFSASDCSVLSLNDVKTVFGPDVTEEKVSVNQGVCSKGWASWINEGTSRTKSDSIALIVTNTSFNYAGQLPSDSLDRTCGTKASAGLGEYKSCNIAGDIFFGKGDYRVELQCVGCPSDYGMRLAKIVESRM